MIQFIRRSILICFVMAFLSLRNIDSELISMLTILAMIINIALLLKNVSNFFKTLGGKKN